MSTAPSFFATPLGRAALASIAAMLALNILALSQQLQGQRLQVGLAPIASSTAVTSAAITGELA